MSTTTPAGWYPDPKPADPTNPGQRWWNGTEWTVSTKTDEPLSVETDVPKQRSRPRRATVVAGTVAALLGLGIGSLTTYLIMDGSDNGTTKAAVSTPGNGGGNGGLFGEGGSGGSSGGSGSTGGSGNLPGGSTGGSTGGDGSTGGSGGTSTSSTTAYDIVDGISLPIPSGWTGGTTTDGFASMYVGSYTCAGSTSGSSSTCSLGGANTETLKASVSAGAKAAAEADIAAAAKEAYNDLNSHTVLESQAVTVAGRSGYLIRWKVDAKVGNDGTVETVVFPTSDNKSLVAVHLGFDTAAKAPDVSVMDTIVSGIKDATVSGASGGTSGTTGSNS
ncbi:MULTISPECIES: DUF2510 domain-containing protein [Streptacidiphilus]|uniref:DUF2510 domain-containing protein n=2 Tax=Streptacidiphilus TaxID=228398 RepID=A0ABV6UTL8_9ACTN|nr:DUF2510 domain-containing protein [Streptacidiphilus jeojiense]